LAANLEAATSYERNYAGNYEDIRFGNLPNAIARGDADRIRKFVESFMAEYDLNGWIAPDLIDAGFAGFVRT
jgi:4-hydroxyphenylacetate 3-monooxygenase